MAKEYYPPMHSAEHILNQTMVRMFGCGRSVDAHIEKKKSRIDFAIGRELSPAEIAEIERHVNEVIGRDLPIREDMKPREDVARWFDLRRVPEDSGDPLRIVYVGDYDACPCIGGHVTSTREIGDFKIVSTSYAGGILRLRFKLDPPPSPVAPPPPDH